MVTVESLAPSDDSLDPARVVEAKTNVGSIWLERDAELMTPAVLEHGYWAPEITALMHAVLRPGMTFVDVGANIGYFSVLGSKLVGPQGRVIAVEADPANISILRANLWKNGCSNTLVLPVAAWFEEAELNLFSNPAGGAGSSVGHPDRADGIVPAVRLDTVIDGTVNYMKVDCEGTDHRVVEGATGLIRANPRMLITVELVANRTGHTGDSPARMLDTYRGVGLKPFRIRPDGKLVRVRYRDLRRPDCRVRASHLRHRALHDQTATSGHAVRRSSGLAKGGLPLAAPRSEGRRRPDGASAGRPFVRASGTGIGMASESVSPHRIESLAPSAESLDRTRVIEAETDVGSIWLERDAELMTPPVLKSAYGLRRSLP